ncbi:hypothetical protein [Oceanobacillus polygoni]|uniref:Nucleic acid-binding Zn-ribbon protein n=1 Tax=Oceanobacillus polygoni TaxID=1235259 RepID=A0A9X1CG74_9BACI|nr:hypothetical protein [Oceanobacillus polygoni]MBP2078100.1 putative nucleic acid-binding Zn-ribbon protein [Oceanobacillus polygoni]
MKNDSNTDNQDTSIDSSLQLALIAAALTTLADLIATFSALEAIDEARIQNEADKQAQEALDARFKTIEDQLKNLEDVIQDLKSGS